MKRNVFKLYGKFFSMNLKTQLQYKGSFVMMFIGQFLTAFSGFISFLIGSIKWKTSL